MKLKSTTIERFMAWRERSGRGEYFTINHTPYHINEVEKMLGMDLTVSKPINTKEEQSHEELEGILVTTVDELTDSGDSESTE